MEFNTIRCVLLLFLASTVYLSDIFLQMEEMEIQLCVNAMEWNKDFHVKDMINKCKKMRKKPTSKILCYILICLKDGLHSHMLKYVKGSKIVKGSQFEIKSRNKKDTKHWTMDDISLFKAVDELSNKKRPKTKYEEMCKNRFRANMSKLKEFFKEISIVKDTPSESIKTFEIIKLPPNVEEEMNKLRKFLATRKIEGNKTINFYSEMMSDTSVAAIGMNPNGSSGMCPNGSSGMSPNESFEMSKNGSSGMSSNRSFEMSPNGSFEMSPNGSFEMSPNGSSGMSSNRSFEMNPNGSFEMSPNGSSGMSSNRSYEMNPNGSFEMSPKGSFEMSPKRSFGMSPKGSFGMSPNGSFRMSPNGSFGMSPNGSFGMSPNGSFGMSPNGSFGMSPNGSFGMSPNGTFGVVPDMGLEQKYQSHYPCISFYHFGDYEHYPVKKAKKNDKGASTSYEDYDIFQSELGLYFENPNPLMTSLDPVLPSMPEPKDISSSDPNDNPGGYLEGDWSSCFTKLEELGI